MEPDMNDINESGSRFGCGCKPTRTSCLDDIACSQKRVAECEARLFCVIADRLGCEIRHARCMRDLDHLLCLTQKFLTASAVKEKAINETVAIFCDCKDC